MSKIKLMSYTFTAALIILLVHFSSDKIFFLEALFLIVIFGCHVYWAKHRLLQRRLFRHKSFLFEFFKHTSDVIFIKDKNHKYIGCNKAFLDAFKMDSEEMIIGKTDSNIVDESVVEKTIKYDNMVSSLKDSVTYHLTIRFKDGDEKVFHILKFPLFMENEFYAIAGIATDITRQEKLKYQLDEKKSQLIAILNSIQSIAYLKGIDGRVIAGNKKFEELAGIGIESLIGKNPASIFEIRDDEVLSSDSELLEKKEIIIFEKEMDTPRGRKWIEIQKTPVFDEQGEIIGITVLITDISERKYLEDLTIKAKEEAIAANNFKSQFLANISHEIRTPVAGIMGFVELLDKAIIDEKQKKLLGNVKKSSELLFNLINSILDLSKIESGKLKLENTVINFREICQNALLLIEAGAKAKNINVKVNYDESIPSELYGDEVKLQQIFNNILSNSIKFIEHGEIVLTCKCLEKKDFFVKLHCEVCDTGIGIEKKNLERIFESFTQADSSITKTYGGAGLGLTICRELLRMMDSDIYIESEFKKGTKVYFTIGLEVPYSQAVEKTDYLSPEKNKEINILLVDKNQPNRDFFEEILSIIDCGYTKADEIEEALELCRNKNFDLIFLNADFEDLSKIKSLKNDGTFLAVIAKNDLKGNILESAAAEIDEIISEPIVIAEVIKIIDKYTSKFKSAALV